MARLNLRLPENAPGELFVDETCIDCDTCRELAPATFGSAANGQSFVKQQPSNDDEWKPALRALVSCPTSSIGAIRSAAVAARELPIEIAPRVFRCGYSSEDSYGAQSYFLQRDDGNVLIDSPRAAAPLLKRLEELGGVSKMFLTHRDDVADHARFRERFGCERIIHKDDDFIGAEKSIDGDCEIGRGLRVIHVPGHTRGSCVLLVDDTCLFTGDHLWATDEGALAMGRSVNWYSWTRQIESLRKLLDCEFEWLLPGHGRSLHSSRKEMREQIEKLSRSF